MYDGLNTEEFSCSRNTGQGSGLAGGPHAVTWRPRPTGCGFPEHRGPPAVQQEGRSVEGHVWRALELGLGAALPTSPHLPPGRPGWRRGGRGGQAVCLSPAGHATSQGAGV